MPAFYRFNTGTMSTVSGYTNVDTGLERYADFLDSPDSIYGPGIDGDVTISTNTTLTDDMYYNNLTINNNVTLNPGGYRIFVKNLLTMGSGSSIGYSTGFSTFGSINQGGETDTAVTHSLGGSSQTRTATPPTASTGGSKYYRVAHQAIRGYAVTAGSASPVFLRGGAGGVGQKGGGVVMLTARYVSATSAFVRAAATSPAGGGVIIFVSTYEVLPPGITTDVSGFSSGTVQYIQVV